MSDDELEPREISHFIYAANPGLHDGFYAVMTQYVETDALNAVGAVYRFFLDEDGEPTFEEALSAKPSVVVHEPTGPVPWSSWG